MVPHSPMSFLAELKESKGRPANYKHVAPNGAGGISKLQLQQFLNQLHIWVLFILHDTKDCFVPPVAVVVDLMDLGLPVLYEVSHKLPDYRILAVQSVRT